MIAKRLVPNQGLLLYSGRCCLLFAILIARRSEIDFLSFL